MRKKEEIAETFDAVDEDGKRYTLELYQTFVEFRPISGEASWSKGSKRFQTVNGDHVNASADGTFILLDSGKKLRRL